jgi:hypothetical protein
VENESKALDNEVLADPVVHWLLSEWCARASKWPFGPKAEVTSWPAEIDIKNDSIPFLFYFISEFGFVIIKKRPMEMVSIFCGVLEKADHQQGVTVSSVVHQDYGDLAGLRKLDAAIEQIAVEKKSKIFNRMNFL